MALPESSGRERLRRFVAAHWVERAPADALGAFEAMDEARMPTMDRLYQDVVRLVPEYRERMRFANPEGDLHSYKLYHYWKDIDPARATRYKERAEGYDGPTK